MPACNSLVALSMFGTLSPVTKLAFQPCQEMQVLKTNKTMTHRASALRVEPQEAILSILFIRQVWQSFEPELPF
jgi:hypothetical protein